MSRAEFKAERDMMEEVRARLFKTVREAAKGFWAHHDKMDRNVV
jgi:hypothetical protein